MQANNVCIFTGNLGADPETKETKAGIVVKLRMAITRNTKEKETDWISLTAFGKTAETADKFLKKGSKIVATASFREEKFTDKDGNKRNSYSFLLDNFQMLDSKKDSEDYAPAGASKPSYKKIDIEEDDEDDPPF